MKPVQQYIGSLKKMKRKKTHVIEKKQKSCFSIRVLGGRVTVLYSMLCVLLFLNFGFGQTIYTGVSSGPGQYAYHRMIVSSKLFTNDALQCAQRKNPY